MVSTGPDNWGTGFVAHVTFTNNTGAGLSAWQQAWTFTGNQQITNLWNGVPTQSGQSVTVGNAAWNNSVPNGGTAAFGFQASFSGTNAAPDNFRLNGVLCARQ